MPSLFPARRILAFPILSCSLIKVGFIELNDGTFFSNIQVVFDEEIDRFEEISKYSIATAIIVKGKLLMTPDAKQKFEIKASEIILEGSSTSDYPLQKKRHSLEYLRTIAHLRPRSNTFSAVFRVRSVAAHAIHTFYQNRQNRKPIFRLQR